MNPLAGILFALGAALTWGSGDFLGGMAARKHNVFQVLVLSSFSGILLLLLCLFVQKETLLSLSSFLWAAASGISGAIGLASFYYGLSRGNTVVVAPTAAVVGAALPVAFGLLTAGFPGILQLSGFILAFLGIGFVSVSSSSTNGSARTGFWIGIISGLFFAGFFIFIGQAGTEQVIAPLIVSRACELLVALLILFGKKLPLPAPGSIKLAWFTGLLDAGGSIFFVLAKQLSRLDISVVLASLYPVITVCLAFLIIKEKISLSQWIGVALCFSSVVLISI